MKKISRQEFNEVYNELILDRIFVENKDYYHKSRDRYYNSLNYFVGLNIKKNAKLLDIGGGQFAILANRLLGLDSTVGDVNDRAKKDVENANLSFLHVDLFDGEFGVENNFDYVTMLEVIEHIPIPPYLVFKRIAQILNDDGCIFLTTPNGYRARNLLYMILNRPVLDNFRYPTGNEVLGHQHEYTRRQIEWQFLRGGLETEFVRCADLGWKGATLFAELAHLATWPLSVFPHFRSNLIAAARLPIEPTGAQIDQYE